jgi:hypothetical protein
MTDAPSIAELWSDAAWHLFSLDMVAASAQCLKLSEAEFHAASFLDQRLLVSRHTHTLPLAEFQSLVGHPSNPTESPSTNFIFHIGHCGSTLVSRALAANTAVLPLREPLGLRQLAAIPVQQRNESWAWTLRLVLAAHSRVFRPGQASMIKATSTCNSLIHPLMELAPQSKSLLLYLPLESYLAGLLGKQTPAIDLRGHAASRLQEWQTLTGNPLQQHEGEDFSEAQLAVLAWLTSMARLLQASARQPGRCYLLNFEKFLADPPGSLEHLIKFFHLDASRTEILTAWPDISVGYSKQPEHPYSAFNRARTLARGRQQRGDEISSGLQWAKKLIQQHAGFQSCQSYL